MSNLSTFFSELLAKATIKFARTQSVAQAYDNSTRLRNRLRYIVKVLEAPTYMRTFVRSLLVELDTPSAEQMVGLLDYFEILNANAKLNFIIAFKTTGTAGGQGTYKIAIDTAYQGGQVPPEFVP